MIPRDWKKSSTNKLNRFRDMAWRAPQSTSWAIDTPNGKSYWLNGSSCDFALFGGKKKEMGVDNKTKCNQDRTRRPTIDRGSRLDLPVNIFFQQPPRTGFRRHTFKVAFDVPRTNGVSTPLLLVPHLCRTVCLSVLLGPTLLWLRSPISESLVLSTLHTLPLKRRSRLIRSVLHCWLFDR